MPYTLLLCEMWHQKTRHMLDATDNVHIVRPITRFLRRLLLFRRYRSQALRAPLGDSDDHMPALPDELLPGDR